ncbi:MAG TPA: tRNA (adenosine(37)-N6)-threonylcarbamoyltransferase complex dimerization subunit type 1 TsaB [Firmicutes bacterium]|nr:tRNA (adenosine(37)-N6)-threonylcarbamoyltransferase complex dimerization subunit type 1 TsaB [Bacillota bacterium]
MIILAIDSSAKTASAALCNENHVLAEFSAHTQLTHSQTLMPMTDSLFRAAGILPGEIDACAVACGPGSFTGLRIGIAAIKGLAQALGKPCVPVSTLEGLAQNLQGVCENSLICPVMDARCGQVYNALFDSAGGKLSRLTEDRAIAAEDLLKEVQDRGKTVFLVGDGADLCYNQYKEVCQEIRLAPPALRFQRAASIGLIGCRLLAEGKTVTPAHLMPAYLRLPQAERNLKK